MLSYKREAEQVAHLICKRQNQKKNEGYLLFSLWSPLDEFPIITYKIFIKETWHI